VGNQQAKSPSENQVPRSSGGEDKRDRAERRHEPHGRSPRERDPPAADGGTGGYSHNGRSSAPWPDQDGPILPQPTILSTTAEFASGITFGEAGREFA
jgi:hypothetical protein